MEIEFGAPGTIMPPADKAVENARRAEADGYESIWWPSHLMGWHPESVWTEDITPLAKFQDNPHTYFDPLVMMGVAGAVTEKIRVGVVVTDVITHHPAVLAQTALTLDHVTKGRAILGLGSGEQLNVGPYGMEWSKPVGHLDEALDVIRLLWNAEGAVDFDGQFYPLKDAVLGLSPYTPGGRGASRSSGSRSVWTYSGRIARIHEVSTAPAWSTRPGCASSRPSWVAAASSSQCSA